MGRNCQSAGPRGRELCDWQDDATGRGASARRLRRSSDKAVSPRARCACHRYSHDAERAGSSSNGSGLVGACPYGNIRTPGVSAMPEQEGSSNCDLRHLRILFLSSRRREDSGTIGQGRNYSKLKALRLTAHPAPG
ncbi:hypothetical protein BV25DRAFT_1828296 [Artomyces pyxidatus]|uniref:Uncharacterized protein n=1 Tax=Artomyces pyxidatus TaxID=48021 RepID=A0ACB8SW41_9AGAM|nr:hypothetical protein BV25DRAFT_1828296 [Artomyces pyxidatus]